MNTTISMGKTGTKNEERKQFELELARHLEQQPESILNIHRWMLRLEAAGAVATAVAFLAALVISFAWKSVDPRAVPIAWFVFAISTAPILILLGLDAVILRAFPAVSYPGRPQMFVTGSGAVWRGWAFILLALIVAAFWGTFIYAVVTLNMAMIAALATIIGVILGVGMAVSIVVSMAFRLIHDLSRSR
ncbi:MAG: hypothetical protein WBM17_09020 [Anaerolineales bacterium]